MTISTDKLSISPASSDLPDSLQDIFAHTFECVARIDFNGCYLSVNSAYAEVSGYDPLEMIGMNSNKTTHPDDLDLLNEKYQELLDRGRAEMQVRGIRKNRSVYYKELLMVKGLESDRSTVHHYCFIRDITDRVLDELTTLKSVKTGLELEEQQFHNLIKNIPGVVFRCDLTDYWSFNFLSDGIQKILGYQAHQLMLTGSNPYMSLIHEDDITRVKESIDLALAQPKTYNVEYRISTKDGRQRWFRERATSMTNEAGKVSWIGGIIRDITESKQASRESHIALSLLENGEDIVFWLNQEGRFVYANSTACERFGYEKEELLQLYYHDIDRNFSPESRRNYLTSLKKSHSGSVIFETTATTKLSEIIHLDVKSNLLVIDEEIYTCVLARDISEQKRIEKLHHIDQTILQMLVLDKSIDEIFSALCGLVKEILPEARMGVFLRPSAAKSFELITFPEFERSSIEKLRQIFANSITGTIQRDEYTVIENVSDSDLWFNCQEFAEANGIASSWIKPFVTKNKSDTGFLVLLHDSCKAISDQDYDLLDKVAKLSCLIIGTWSARQRLYRYQKIVESTNDMTMYLDSEHYIRAANDNYAKACNLSKDDILDKHCADIVGVDTFIEKIKPRLLLCLKGQHLEYRKWLHLPAYGNRFYQFKMSPVMDLGRVVGVTILLRDITEESNVSETLK